MQRKNCSNRRERNSDYIQYRKKFFWSERIYDLLNVTDDIVCGESEENITSKLTETNSNEDNRQQVDGTGKHRPERW